MKKNIYVVGAVIVRDNQVLCAQRGDTKTLPFKWEFPGGKIEEGESPEKALEREVQEEMECSITVGTKIETTRYEYDFGIVHLTTYFCQLTAGEPVRTEHNEFRWLKPDQLMGLDWAPASIPSVQKIEKNAWIENATIPGKNGTYGFNS